MSADCLRFQDQRARLRSYRGFTHDVDAGRGCALLHYTADQVWKLVAGCMGCKPNFDPRKNIHLLLPDGGIGWLADDAVWLTSASS